MTTRQSSSADKSSRGSVIRAAAVALLMLAPVGCRAPSPPPRTTTVVPAAPPPAAVRRLPEAVSANWSFAITETGCIAHASNRDVSLTVRVGHRFELSVSGIALQSIPAPAGTWAQLRFDSAGGSWTLPARGDSHRAVVAIVQPGERARNDVLMLLGGGSLRTELRNARVPVLRIPDSDVSGRDWFDCVRREMRRVARQNTQRGSGS